jgi:hypothetical protein
MDPRDDDIEFDFFDDEPTSEAEQPQRGRMPRRGGGTTRGPRRLRPPHGAAPLLRLVLLVVLAIAIVVILVELLSSCASSSRHDSYAKYMDKVSEVASSSEANGRKVATALTTPGAKVADLEATLRGISEAESQNVEAAQNISPPGRLRDEHQHVVEALQLRVSGLDGLATTFQQTANSTTSADAGVLAAQADRFVASDVVWDDLFKARAERQLQEDGVTGVRVPDSTYVQNRDLLNQESMTNVLKRLSGATKGGTPTGLHGTNIISTKALPANQVLQQDADNTVVASTDLAFALTIEDSGDSQEVQIKCTLTVEGANGPIVKTQTIDVINPGEQKTVVFKDLGQVKFATKTTLKVDVKAVPGETKIDNNSASYPVIFSLG